VQTVISKKKVLEGKTSIARELGFDDLENDNFRELLNSHSEQLTDDFLLLDQ
jgi:hypothetical protein